MREQRLFETTQWLAWIGSTIVACVATTAFAFSTFETKEHVKEIKVDNQDRLSRIENKVDKILMNIKGDN